MQKIFIHKKILVVPLDWGLGHATRCIPLIRQLLEMNCEVIVASSGEQLILLQKEFPQLSYVYLQGYRVSYSKQKRWFPVKILTQTPKILLSIRREHQWLQKIITEKKINAVISDNRYGLYTRKIPCVFMTHQLRIKAPNKWLEDLMQKINYRFISRFEECWVPDLAGEMNIAGSLSHPAKMPPAAVKYIGALSRFALNDQKVEKKYDYAFILSGPEPQRTIFEEKVLNAVDKLGSRCMVVRGKPGEETQIKNARSYTIVNHLATSELQEVLAASEFIVSRCGYTTVMEILLMRKKSILIPTPGQTEQEYLAEHLMQQRWCYCCKQEDDLLFHFNKAKEFQYRFPSFEKNNLQAAIESFLQNLNTGNIL